MTKPDHPTPEIIWECKIGGPVPGEMPNGWDSPMRRAVQAAFLSLTGVDAEFTFSGRGQLTEGERAVVEKRAPTSPASGALPALPKAVAHVFVGEDTEDVFTGDQMRAYALAALASREASPAPLPESLRKLRSYVDEAINSNSEYACDLKEDLRNIRDYVRDVVAALASPQVAPAPDLSKLTGEQIDTIMTMVEDYGGARAETALFNARLSNSGRLAHPRFDAIRNALAALVSPKVALEGWKLVPIEPTPAMLRAVFHADKSAEAIWNAMLGATPVQVAPDQRNAMRAFEAWYCSDGNYEPEELDKLAGGACYANADTENMWQAWQGAFLHVATPVQVAPTATPPAEPARIWSIRRYGSEPEKGYTIVAKLPGATHGNPVAFLGDGALAGDAAQAICDAHNAASSPSPAPVLTDDSAILQVIDERDEREEVINDLCDAVLGKDREEWSSAYGFADAVSDVRERMDTLSATQAPAPVAPQDDARDAAKALTDEQIIKAVSPHLFFNDSPDGDNSTDDVLKTARALLALASPQVAPALTDEQMVNALRYAMDKANASGSIRGEMVGQFCNRIKEMQVAAPAPVAPTKVFLVATGEVVDGLETYTRHEGAPPPLCDSELLYAAPVATTPAQPSPQIPEGWRLVPIEPTMQMTNAAWDHTPYNMDDMTDGDFVQAYKDMLAAAPLPSEPEGEAS